jgi:hypothetical protein
VRLLAAALLAAALHAPPPPRADDTAVDIEIAIDTTGSMTPSIENAQRDARKIVANTQQTLPNARFAIVQFRDEGDSPEYEVAPALTGRRRLRSPPRLTKLHADGGGDSPESYNLVFQRAVTDQGALGFRPGRASCCSCSADAEPPGPGGDGLAGCSDDSATRTARHRPGARRPAHERDHAQPGPAGVSAQTSLRCYLSLGRPPTATAPPPRAASPAAAAASASAGALDRPRRRARVASLPVSGAAPRTRSCPRSAAPSRASSRPSVGRAEARRRREHRARADHDRQPRAEGRTPARRDRHAAAGLPLRRRVEPWRPGRGRAPADVDAEPVRRRRPPHVALVPVARGRRSGSLRLAARFTMDDGGAFTARRRASVGVR